MNAIQHAATAAGVVSPLAWNPLADLGRQQMAVAAEGASAMFRGFETMRKIQEQAAHQARVRHAAAAEKLKEGCPANELLAIQADLLRFDIEAATRYWQQLGAAALEMQTEMMGCATHLADTEAMLEAASAVSAFESAIPGLNQLLAPNPNGAGRRRRYA